MPKMKKKNISSPVVNDSDSEKSSDESNPPPKKQKKESSTAKRNADTNEVEWNISADKIVKIREFRGKLYIDIRQYYNGPNGDLLPTKKGISLTAENYQKLKSLISQIDEELKNYCSKKGTKKNIPTLKRYILTKIIRESKPLSFTVIEIVRSFIIEDDKLTRYVNIYENEISRSLDVATSEEAAIKSFVTYVNKLPTGKEKGNFLGLDFGGPTVRILLLSLSENKCEITVESFDIPARYMTGKSARLFDFIAKCLSDFMKTVKLKMLRIPLGVTFGFPIEQISLQDCRLMRWTKGFQCDDLIGKNIFSVLKDSIRKYPDLKRVYVIGILNETVSVLLASTVQDPNCKIGMVIGHVANCCYAEKVSRISKYQAQTYAEKYMYMNLDSSGFGENGCLDEFRTEFDTQLDNQSSTPGKLITEKMTSITYLGELARLALVRCIELNLILGGVTTPRMATKGALYYTDIMRIESDPEDDHAQCRAVLEELGYSYVGDFECVQIQFVCRCVSRRAANLIAAQLAALMNRINEPVIALALEGEMIRDYPNFEWYLIRKLNQLKKEDQSVVKLEENGLGRGAAVMAAVFGEEVMDRDEKLRRLPGFPVSRCHFGKTGKCLNPNCKAKHPCDISGVNPLQSPIKTESQDLSQACFNQKHCPNPCVGYDQL